MKALDGLTASARAAALDRIAGYAPQTLIDSADGCTIDRLTELFWDRHADSFVEAFRSNDAGCWEKTAKEQRAKQTAFLGESLREMYLSGSIPLPDAFYDIDD